MVDFSLIGENGVKICEAPIRYVPAGHYWTLDPHGDPVFDFTLPGGHHEFPLFSQVTQYGDATLDKGQLLDLADEIEAFCRFGPDGRVELNLAVAWLCRFGATLPGMVYVQFIGD